MNTKRVISLVLAVLMLSLLLLPSGALADDFDFFVEDYPEESFQEELFEENNYVEEYYEEPYTEPSTTEEDLFVEEPYVEEPYVEENLYDDSITEDAALFDEEQKQIVENAEFALEDTAVFDAASPVITEDPVDYIVASAGEKATFTVTATGTGPLKYRWYYKEASGSDWVRWTGKSEATMTCNVTAARDGMQVRCLVIDANNNEATSKAATMSISAGGPVITADPVDYIVSAAGEKATFTVTATGAGPLKFRWYYKEASGSNWVRWTGKSEATLTCNVTAARDGMQVRCLVIDANEMEVTSKAATMSISAGGPVITADPTDFSVAAAGAKATFTVTATGAAPLKYAWYSKAPGSSSWVKWTGKTEATLTCNVTSDRDGMQVHCVVTDANGQKATSKDATMTIAAASGPVITTDPTDFSVSAAGAKATFTVTATGTAPLKYAWYSKAPGSSSWVKWSGKTAATLTCNVTADRNGMQVHCVVTDANGQTATSKDATMTIAAPLTITQQPEDFTVSEIGAKATFSVTATGAEPLKYAWYSKAAGTEEWVKWSGKTTATMTCNVTSDRDGMQVRCVVTDANGQQVTSDAATMKAGISQDGVSYKLLEDGTLEIAAYSGSAKNVTIPGSISGYIVSKVGAKAFMGNTDLEEITLPNSITVIGAEAFKGCTNLSKMNAVG